MTLVPTEDLPENLRLVPAEDLPSEPARQSALQLTRANIMPSESIGQKFVRKLGEGYEALTQPPEAGEGFSPLMSILKRAGAINLIPPFALQDALAEKAGEVITTETDSPVAGGLAYGTINAINPLAILKSLQLTGKASKAAMALKELEAGKVGKAAELAANEQDILRMFKSTPTPRVPRMPTEEELITDMLVKNAKDSYRPDIGGKEGQLDRLLTIAGQPGVRAAEVPTQAFTEAFTEKFKTGGSATGERIAAKLGHRPGEPLGISAKIGPREVERFIATGTTEIPGKHIRMKLLPAEETTARLLLGSAEERVARVPAGPQAPQLSHVGNFLRGIFQESTREVARFGAPGRVLAGDMMNAINQGEREAGTSITLMTKAIAQLSPAEKANLVDVLDIGAAPISKNVTNATSVVRPMLEDVAQRSFRAGITIKNPITSDVIPFAPRPDGNFFPHFSLFDFSEIHNNPGRLAEATREIQTQLARNGKVVSLAEARQTLDIMTRKAQRRFGNLEISRVFDFPEFDRDPTRALTRYFDGAFKRVNMAEVFQANFRDADELVNMIGQTSGDLAQKMAKTYVNRITGREELGLFGQSAEAISRPIRSFEVITKMGTSAIANASQSALTAVVAGMKNTMRGLKDVAFGEGAEFAGLTGATLTSTLNDIQRSLGAGRASTKFLRAVQFSRIEQFNRMLAANAGRHFANDVFGKLQSSLANGSKRAGVYRETLEKMNINVSDALGRGMLSLDDQIKAGQDIVRRTQFKGGIEDLPLFFTSPTGKTVTQFKPFGFKAAQMLKDDILLEAKRGNFGPLTRAALILPLTGEAVNGVQSMISGRARPENVAVRIAEDVAAVGTVGIYFSMIMALEFGPSAIASMIGGAGFGDFVNILSNVTQATKGNPKNIEKQIVRNIPVVGPAIANRVFPPKPQTR